MPFYFVNKHAQDNGDHEVHESNCLWLPEEKNRQGLGYFSNCHEAVKKAKKEYYSQSNGCKYCCPDCHTG
ncbi:MAG: hypothetical protein PHN81_05995 [Actinomycetota bacterium]|jgi:hypothetical protein|nr:hypothetical protein [Actinomycetota bacterium]